MKISSTFTKVIVKIKVVYFLRHTVQYSVQCSTRANQLPVVKYCQVHQIWQSDTYHITNRLGPTLDQLLKVYYSI